MIRVGLIGYGLSGRVFHAPFIDFVSGLTLSAVVTSQASLVHERYPRVDVLETVDELVARPDIDVVIVTSPNHTHFQYAKDAILHGKSVVVEKPLTVTTAEADELIALAKAKGVVLSVYQNRRWDHDFQNVKQVVLSGALGSLAVFESHFERFRPQVQDRWKEWDEPGAGVLYDLGSHLIDQALCLFGPPETVYADLAKQRAGSKVVDWFHLVMQYGQMRVILQSGSLIGQQGPRFTLHGTAGSFVETGYDAQEAMLRQGITPDGSRPGYHTYYDGIVKALRDGEAPPVRAEDARTVIRVIECAEESAKAGKVIAFR